MIVQVVKWGNSQRNVIPKAAMEESGFALNESLDLKAENGRIVLSKAFRHKTLEERAEELDYRQIQEIADTVQAIFDYYPYG